MLDLHTHTTASDGVLSPTELVNRALANGVHTLAITDHDSVAGYLEMLSLGVPQNLSLISGVEVSCVWRGIGIHIVGLNFSVSDSPVVALLEQQSQTRIQRARAIIDILAKKGMPLTWEEVTALSGSEHVGRPHIAQAMVDRGYVNNMNAAFKKYLGAGKAGDVKNGWVSVPDTVRAIRESGGVAVIAHPTHYTMTRTKLMELMDDFQSAGGQAIEVISGRQPQSLTQKLALIAQDRGLYASMGSDFHRPLSYKADVGCLAEMPSTVSMVTELI